ncbi:MAG: hypothetical protein KBB29_03950 [Bacteroidales bacterium]|mgnify:CR=1 FL=1|jgi:hypothetical protein|nr:hypothetical protein [Bacteroidales bacterium]HOW21390.1 hypothetical protein [Tenuifilaceae bacterium]HPG99517.1 hypothetical protein [Tenuifilaceae bacterium]HPM90166.1 hypothetical protein [Tenuifilaceae bacterium]
MLNFKRIVFFVSGCFLIFGLTECNHPNKSDNQTIKEDVSIDTLPTLIKYESSIFPIPSPWQVVGLVKNLSIPYNENLLNRYDRYQKYGKSFKQALNLGIYGADISYLCIYDRTQEAIKYLDAIRKLCDQLGLEQIFDQNFFDAVEQNINNKDSLARIITKAYSSSDLYLKTNERSDIGALIVAGSWIESMYFLTQIALGNSNRDIINRFGEQKHPLDNLIELLTPYYYKSSDFSELIDELINVAYEYDGIIYSYKYKEPIIDAANRQITINSTTQVVVSEYHIRIISSKIESIRNKLVE